MPLARRSGYLVNAGSDDTDGINLVKFADGTQLTRSQLLAMAGSSVVNVDDTYNPVVTQLAQNVVANTEVSAANLFTAADASGSGIRLYQISNDQASGAYFSLNGTVYSPGQAFQVAANQLSQLQYLPGASGSTDTLTVTAFDGFALGNATSLSLSVMGSNTSLFQAHWSNSDGSYSTDDYQYTAGGAPGGSGMSFTETYSDSSGDQGTRQYSATTGVTSLSWYSSATGTLTGTTSDSGFIGCRTTGS